MMKKIIMLIGVLALQACIQRPFAEAYLEKSLKDTIAENYEELPQEKKACIDEPTTSSTENKLFFQYGMTSYDYCRIYEKTPEYKKFKILQDKKNQQKAEMAKENEFRENMYCSAIYDSYSEYKNKLSPDKIYKKAVEKIFILAKQQGSTFTQEQKNQIIKKIENNTHAEMYALTKELDSECIKKERNKWTTAIQEYINKIDNYYRAQEQKIIAKRTGGKTICSIGWDSLYLFQFNQETPNRNCIYIIPPRTVKAFQVTRNGILASYNLFQYGLSISFYFHKNNELNNVVDGSYINGLFIYTGPYRYQSLSGERTLHSFKALNWDKILKGIEFL